MCLVAGNVMAEDALKGTHTVVVVLEARRGKEDALKAALIKVRDLSLQESGCLAYHVHRSLNNSAQFILYENWESKAAHSKQFQKPYIMELENKLELLLAKPYQLFMAKVI
jgi:quinol monooxygenase YgiN